MPDLSPENAARSPEYAQLLLDAAAAGQCLLDPAVYFAVTPPEDVLLQTEGWVLGRAKFPYANTEEPNGHLMVFPERHIVTPDEMTEDEQLVYWRMLKRARDDFGASTGAVVMRYSADGNHAAVGSTIAHLHAHLIVPELDPQTGRVLGSGTPEARIVSVKIG